MNPTEAVFMDEMAVLTHVSAEPLTDRAVQELEAVQRAIKVCREARGACMNIYHRHDTDFLSDGTDVGEPVALVCWECGEQAHYDNRLKDYFHNRPLAPACRTAGVNTESPCQPGETEQPT